MSRKVLEHYALFIKNVPIDWRPKLFRTLDVWLGEPGFKNLVQKRWVLYQANENSVVTVKDKLKSMKINIKDGRKRYLSTYTLRKTK